VSDQYCPSDRRRGRRRFHRDPQRGQTQKPRLCAAQLSSAELVYQVSSPDHVCKGVRVKACEQPQMSKHPLLRLNSNINLQDIVNYSYKY